MGCAVRDLGAANRCAYALNCVICVLHSLTLTPSLSLSYFRLCHCPYPPTSRLLFSLCTPLLITHSFSLSLTLTLSLLLPLSATPLAITHSLILTLCHSHSHSHSHSYFLPLPPPARPPPAAGGEGPRSSLTLSPCACAAVSMHCQQHPPSGSARATCSTAA